MPVTIVRQDITKIKADAIVSASGHDLTSHGAVSAAIFEAAGPGLSLECAKKKTIDTTEAFVTGAYRLPAKHVIHTAGPSFKDGHSGEELLLAATYRNCMEAAAKAGCESIAFPLISSGGYGFPKEEALSTAMDAIASSPYFGEMDVTLVVFDRDSYEVSSKLKEGIRNFILEESEPKLLRQQENSRTHGRGRRSSAFQGMGYQEVSCAYESDAAMPSPPTDIRDAIRATDENFADSLKRLIAERGMKNSECYTRANISKAVFSNIMTKPDYKPAKTTAMAFAFALKLDLEETRMLLSRAGFALSPSFPQDLAVEYLIRKKVYDISKVNAVLFDLDLQMLGEKYG